MVASLSSGSIVKGLISALLGLALTMVGAAPIDNIYRYTFGNRNLNAGFTIVALSIGVFAVIEVISAAKEKYSNEIKTENIAKYEMKGIGLSLKEFKEQFGNFIRSSLIGTGIGILPGIGGGVSNLIAYSSARNSSKYPEKFGTGIIDGIVAPETANNATIGGAMIPLLTIGIPGDTVTAMMLGGFLIHGITPGPMLFRTQGQLVYGIFAALFIANIVMLVIELGGINLFVKVLRIPKHILLPIIVVLCCVGAFGVNNRVFDVQTVAFFGILGYIMQKFALPNAPLMLGFILGSTTELHLRRGLQLTNGNFWIFFTHPIAAAFLVFSVISIIFTIFSNIRKNGRR
jgi:putative tricarboxylic transport membrane protein